MKKRNFYKMTLNAFLLLALLFLLPAKLCAQLRLFDGGLAFNLIDSDSLYPEYLADPYSLTSGFKYFQVTNYSGVPQTILASNGTEYVEIPFAHYSESEFSSRNSFYQIKGFINLSFARLELWDFFKAEVTTNGGINTVFQAFGGTDTLGFDGIWRLAGTLRLFDAISLRYGWHHFSGHWGDETISDLPQPGDADYIPYTHLEEYTRASSHVFGLSANPKPWARLYFEAELPMLESWIRPGIHVPAGFLSPTGDDLAYHILNQEGLVEEVGSLPASYKAWRLQAGAELRCLLGDWGSLFLAGDFQLHQDGQTLHQVGGYDPENPWEFEYTVGGGLEYEKGFLGRKIRVEAFYHAGRFPLTNYFFLRSDYISVGLAINN